MINKDFSKIMVFASVMLMDILAGMEFDLFVPSFPEIKSGFNLSSFAVEALLSINYIGFCVSLFFVGALADHYGRKPVILISLIVFIIGSGLCLWGPNYEILILGRFLQGVGISAPSSLSFLIVADTYPLKQQQSFISFLNGAINMAVGGAPVIGSYLTQYYHWQGNFMALLIFGIVTFILAVIFIPVYQLPKIKETISIRDYIPIFTSYPLMLLIIHIVAMATPYWLFVGMSPILYIEDLGVSLSHFGYYQGSLALVFAIGSIGFGLFVQQYNQKKLLQITNIIFIISLIALLPITCFDVRDPLFITVAFLPFLIAQIVPCAIIYTISLNFMPHAKGKVSAALQGCRLIISALCLQIAGYFYRGSFQNIGIIIIILIAVSIITLWLIIKNQEIMNPSHTS